MTILLLYYLNNKKHIYIIIVEFGCYGVYIHYVHLAWGHADIHTNVHEFVLTRTGVHTFAYTSLDVRYYITNHICMSAFHLHMYALSSGPTANSHNMQKSFVCLLCKNVTLTRTHRHIHVCAVWVCVTVRVRMLVRMCVRKKDSGGCDICFHAVWVGFGECWIGRERESVCVRESWIFFQKLPYPVYFCVE